MVPISLPPSSLQGAAQTLMMMMMMMIDPAGPDLGPVQNHIQSSHIQLNMHMCISGATTAQKKRGNNAPTVLVVRVRGVIGSFY